MQIVDVEKMELLMRKENKDVFSALDERCRIGASMRALTGGLCRHVVLTLYPLTLALKTDRVLLKPGLSWRARFL